MKEIIIKNIKNSLYAAGFLILIVLLAQNCNSYQYHKLDGEYTTLKENLKIKNEKINQLENKIKRQKDSLNNQILLRKKENANLILINKAIDSKINRLQKKLKMPPSITDLESSLKFFNERYKTDLNRIIENKIALFEYTALDVATELIQGDTCIELNEELTKKTKNQDTIINNLNKDVDDLCKQNASLEELALENEAYRSSAKDNIKNLETQNKKPNRKTLFTKILIPVAAVGGYYLGKKL
jgi:hypothetical protein